MFSYMWYDRCTFLLVVIFTYSGSFLQYLIATCTLYVYSLCPCVALWLQTEGVQLNYQKATATTRGLL
jgi:hypothetical protein